MSRCERADVDQHRTAIVSGRDRADMMCREWCRMYVSAAQAAESMQACASESGSQAGDGAPDGDLGA